MGKERDLHRVDGAPAHCACVVSYGVSRQTSHGCETCLEHEETDERDRLIALKGVRNGAYLLGTGVITSIGCALATDGNVIFVHVLFAFLVMAQLLEYGSQLYFYRRGA